MSTSISTFINCILVASNLKWHNQKKQNSCKYVNIDNNDLIIEMYIVRYIYSENNNNFYIYTDIVLKTLKPLWAVDMITPDNCGCQCNSLISF